MPEKVSNEIIPYLLEASEHAPDAPGPLVFVYPFDEYNRYLECCPEKISGIFADEYFIKDALNQGFPLNTVISTGNLRKLLLKNPERFIGSVLLFPANSLDNAFFEMVCDFINKGGNVLTYGSLKNAVPALLQELGIENYDGISGELKLKLHIGDENGYPEKIYHSELLSDGKITECVKNGSKAKILAEVSSVEGKKRLLAVSKELKDGKLVWVRTGNFCRYDKDSGVFPSLDPEKFFHLGKLMRFSLKEFGINISFKQKKNLQNTPIMTVSRNKNAFWFSGFVPDTNITEEFEFPYGAPLFTGTDATIFNGKTSYSLPRTWHCECRIFVKQNDFSELRAKEICPLHPTAKRRIFVKGLKNAELTFFPEIGYEQKTFMVNNDYVMTFANRRIDQGNINIKPEVIKDSNGTYFKYKSITGDVLFSW